MEYQRNSLAFTAESMKVRESVDIPELDINDRRASRRSSLSSDQFGLTDSSMTRSVSEPVELFLYGTQRIVYVRDTSGCELTTIAQGQVVRVSNMDESGAAFKIQRPVVGWIFQADHVTKCSDGSEDVNDWNKIMVPIEDDQIDVPGPVSNSRIPGKPSLKRTAASTPISIEVPNRIRVSGVTKGYNSGLLGTYTKLERLHEGRVCYRKNRASYHLRWYPKDQRWSFNYKGLQTNTNGCAEVQENVVCPHLVTQPWVVFRGKKLGWVEEPNMKIDVVTEKEMTQTGRVKTWIADRGFGFIRPTGPNSQHGDVFVHVHDLADGLEELYVGENVRYDIEINDRNGKTQAVNVVGDHRGTTGSLSNVSRNLIGRESFSGKRNASRGSSQALDDEDTEDESEDIED